MSGRKCLVCRSVSPPIFGFPSHSHTEKYPKDIEEVHNLSSPWPKNLSLSTISDLGESIGKASERFHHHFSNSSSSVGDISVNMDKITDVTFSKYTESRFVQPLRMHYKQDGIEKSWDLVKVHQSVCILIFNITRKVFVFVKQFRPPVYYSAIPLEHRKDNIDVNKYPGRLGVTIELCAGVVDKAKTLEEIAKEEVLEECGYDVPLFNLEEVITFKSGVGIAGDRMTFFFAEVTDDMRVSSGGGLEDEGELIEVIEMPLDETRHYIHQREVSSPSGFLFALNWFFLNRASKYT